MVETYMQLATSTNTGHLITATLLVMCWKLLWNVTRDWTRCYLGSEWTRKWLQIHISLQEGTALNYRLNNTLKKYTASLSLMGYEAVERHIEMAQPTNKTITVNWLIKLIYTFKNLFLGHLEHHRRLVWNTNYLHERLNGFRFFFIFLIERWRRVCDTTIMA